MSTYKGKLLIAYDGTNYSGWQIQPNAISIQELIQNALQTLLGHPTTLIGSGRTDAGVHAMGQVAHFTSNNPLDLNKLHTSLNALLPSDIRIISVDNAPSDFHARYSAMGKIYHYHLHTDKTLDPFTSSYRVHVPYLSNLSLLEKAVNLFVGTHDFTSFSNEAHRGSASKNAVRTIKRISLIHQPGGLRLEFEGNGFLYKMVRNIVGTLLCASQGKILLSDLPEIIEAKDRTLAGPSAPAKALFLMQVHYPPSDRQTKVSLKNPLMSDFSQENLLEV